MTKDLQFVYENRPFKIRNADELEFSEILDIFVEPTRGLTNPFEFENSIVKGRMGSGKTMYLRANYAFYLYSLVPSLITNGPLILPVYIKLSDFQHLTDPRAIYNGFILKLIKEIALTPNHIRNAERLESIHRGVAALPNSLLQNLAVTDLLMEFKKLSAVEYTEKLKVSLGGSAKAKLNFFEASAKFDKEIIVELKNKTDLGIGHIEDAYKTILEPSGGKLLLLIDEAGALAKTFFSDDTGNSLFEVLMNQLRTAEYIRTKVAVYPHSYSDILAETRYGDIVSLQEDIVTATGYSVFRTNAIALANKYVGRVSEAHKHYDVFDISTFDDEKGEVFEQIINASSGNIRRLMQLFDSSMNEAFKRHQGNGKVTIDDVLSTLSNHVNAMESHFSDADMQFLKSLIKACKSRGYKFQFPYKAPILHKFSSKSAEHNILSVIEYGTGQRGTVYAFDYAYCVHNEIPTHHIRGTEKIDKSRSRQQGEWITRISKISDELIAQANLPGKIDGVFEWISEDAGFIRGSNGKLYFWTNRYIIPESQNKPRPIGKAVRFYPGNVDEALAAFEIEIL